MYVEFKNAKLIKTEWLSPGARDGKEKKIGETVKGYKCAVVR